MKIDQETPLYSERLLRHFREARLAGELPPPAVSVTVANPACGDTLKLSALVAGGRIEDARFLVRGCTSSIACGSALAEWLIHAAIDDLQRKTGAEIAAAVEAEVGGLTNATRHAAQLMADGVRELLKRLGA